MNLRERLKSAPAFGLMLTYPNAVFAELAAWIGMDFVILDCEHGVVDETAQLDVLRTLAESNTFVFVRIRTNDESAVARYLDFGADGIMVPDVRTYEQAKRVALGASGRWTVGLRCDRHGLRDQKQKIEPILLIALIESPEGVENIEEILSVEEISGVVVGTGDLSKNLGISGQFSATPFLNALQRVERAAHDAGKILGAKVDADFPMPVLIDRGYRLLLIGRDVLIMRDALRQALESARRAATQGQ